MQCVQRLFQRSVTGSGGGEKGKRCGVKWATDKMLRLPVLSKPDEGNFLKSGLSVE
jgi:hypothetical protein